MRRKKRKMNIYCVANMDIVGSRRVKDREQLQNNLNSYIEQLNRKYSDILVAPITITLGDEWQFIINKPSKAYSLIHEFQQLLWRDNVELYAGIGIGELSTLVSDDVRKMDGPCFHAARDAFKIIKETNKLKSKYSISKLNRVFLLSRSSPNNNFKSDILDFYYNIETNYSWPAYQEIAISRETEDVCANRLLPNNKLILERTINLIIENNEILKSKMTHKQKKVYVAYMKLRSYRKVVEVLENTTRETIGGISQKLNSASYFTIQRNQQVVSLLLDTFCSPGE